jgi:hypothetical protein
VQLEVHTHVLLALVLFAQLLVISARRLAAFPHLVCDAQARATSGIVLLHLIVVCASFSCFLCTCAHLMVVGRAVFWRLPRARPLELRCTVVANAVDWESRTALTAGR